MIVLRVQIWDRLDELQQVLTRARAGHVRGIEALLRELYRATWRIQRTVGATDKEEEQDQDDGDDGDDGNDGDDEVDPDKAYLSWVDKGKDGPIKN